MICAKCGAPMVLRVAKSTGREFYGCSTFPKCFGKKGLVEGESVTTTAVVESREATDEEAQAVADTPKRATLEFRGVHAEFLADTTPEIDLEGSLSCGKTTVALWKELEALKKHPGIWILVARWVEDQVKTLLRPAFEQLARIHGSTHTWVDKFNYYEMGNGSRCYMFGLKTISTDNEQRYGKLRGLAVSRIYIDQAEQLPEDIAGELRLRLRPDIEARLRGVDYPRQLTFSPNPTNFDHWLAKQFPETNKTKGRRYYSLSLFDNAHNLPDQMIENVLTQYPVVHPKHQTVIMGRRGLNVIGDAVYDKMFDRDLHVMDVEWDRDVQLIEAFELGKHNPVWVIAQRTRAGRLNLIGGMLGERLMLADFLPHVERTRREWFPPLPGRPVTIKTCVSPMGEHDSPGSDRYTLISLLRKAKFKPTWRDNANAHDVQLATIEDVGDMLREGTIAINADAARWQSVAPDKTVKERPFMAFAFEGGYVWDAHDVSVSNKSMRQPFVDDEYSTASRCVENLVLNFCAGQPSSEDRAARMRKAAEQSRGNGYEVSVGGKAPWMI